MRRISTILRPFFTTAVLIVAVMHTAWGQEPASGAQPGGAIGAASPPSPVYFENGMNTPGIPFRVIDNNMIITIRVNDSVSFDAAFDSGFPMNGVIILDSDLGGTLNLSYVSEIPLGGGGEGFITAQVAVGGTVDIPGARFTDQRLLVVSQDVFSGRPANAIIGGTLLNSCIVEIDHDQEMITLYNSGSFDAENSGEEFDLSFSMGIPVVDVTLSPDSISSIAVKLLFDTGADVPLSLHADLETAVKEPELSHECYISDGIGGAVYGKWGRISRLDIGEFALSDILVAYPTEGFDIVVAQLGQDGFFGYVLQSRFNITFDYTKGKIYLNPSRRFTAPFEFNMAGLVLNSRRSGYRVVKDVIRGSSGDVADIKTGDIIMAVNGKDTRDLSDPELEELFVQDGQELLIVLKRESKQIERSLVLKRLF